MNIIIAGAGEVGGHAAEVLSSDGQNVTVIDLSAERLQLLADTLDLRTLVGHCAHLDVLDQAGVARCDLLIAATQIDEINLLAAFMAKTAGAKKTIVRVHHTANFKLRRTPVAAKLGIDELICPEHLTSLAIARTIRNPGSIALEEFGRGQLLMQRFPVSPGATAIGAKLANLRLPAGAWVATVERNGDAVIASADTVVEKGDFVTLIGSRETFESARKMFHKGKEKHHQIVVMGEGSAAVWVCRALRSRAFSVRLFAQTHDRAEELSEKLSHVTVLLADPTEKTIFEDEHIEKTHVFIAVTNDDEHNLLSCAQAKALGIPTAIAVVARSKYLHLLAHVGIDHAFSPRQVAVKAIESLMEFGPSKSLATFANGIAEVYQIHPGKRSRVLGHELRDIKLPNQTMIAAIRRGENVCLPGAEDQILASDTILAIGPVGVLPDLRKLFATK